MNANIIYDVINYKDGFGKVICLEFINKDRKVVKKITDDYYEEYKRDTNGIVSEYKDSTGYRYKIKKSIKDINKEFSNNIKSFLRDLK